MKLIQYTDFIPAESFVATVGFFDGLHLGHRFLLERLKAEAAREGKKTLVISFAVHPQTVLKNNYLPKLLTTNAEKIELLNDVGIDACVLLPFDEEMMNLSAYDFLEKIIKKQLGVSALLIGYDHRFGKNREEGFPQYVEYGKQLGINILPVEAFENGEAHISSSYIRKLLLSGQIEEANYCLGRRYRLNGKVVDGEKLGREIGFPTANLNIDPQKLLPEAGVYAVWVRVNGKVYKGMLNIGCRPTVNRTNRTTVEVHILDFIGEIYGEMLEIDFVRKIRNEQKFNSMEELTVQLEKDKLEIEKSNI
ncbi:MAG: bifunctional riboflavin kinase/FAD synthetase [Prevotellaceae bacterium]|nr:bifunctional riboflavin kinase/FAD synthetase [Prevotellaceae bacterium]